MNARATVASTIRVEEYGTSDLLALPGDELTLAGTMPGGSVYVQNKDGEVWCAKSDEYKEVAR